MTELTAGLVVFVILVIAATAVVIPVMGVFAKSNELAELNNILDTVANFIISGAHDLPGLLSFDVNPDGILTKNGEPVLSKAFYKNKSVKINYSPDLTEISTEYILTVRIFSDRDNGEMISREYYIKPFMLNKYN
ncbi:MAG: hypothetical protein FWH10_02365 [Oscillospiraceae bacterium]|nr:hypothetical protein [Oscillospiraceae bacterium]